MTPEVAYRYAVGAWGRACSRPDRLEVIELRANELAAAWTAYQRWVTNERTWWGRLLNWWASP